MLARLARLARAARVVRRGVRPGVLIDGINAHAPCAAAAVVVALLLSP